jgi:hypothetical protein
MPRDFFDPPPEQQIVVLLDSVKVRQAESLIESCEVCNPDAEIPFYWILDRVSGRDPEVTDYILEAPAKCPNCRRLLKEKTLIEWRAAE